MKKLGFALSFLVIFSTAATANTLDSTHGDWNVYTSGKDVCYIASIPTTQNGNFKKRGQPYILVNSKGKNDEINVSSGYGYKAKTPVEISVDGKKYKLFSQGENAWAKDAASDKAIVNAMKTGSKVEVKGLSSKGSYSIDDYSLKGISAAYKRMKQLCK